MEKLRTTQKNRTKESEPPTKRARTAKDPAAPLLNELKIIEITLRERLDTHAENKTKF